MKKILAVLCVGLALYMGSSIVFAKEQVYTYQTITVTSGDTMWDIASHFAEPGDDVQEVIFNICQLNNLQSKNLQPGQKLKIKVKAANDIMLAAK